MKIEMIYICTIESYGIFDFVLFDVNM